MEVGVGEAVVSGFFLLVGGFLGKGVEWMRARSINKTDEKKVDSQLATTEVEKAAVIYRELISDLRKDINEMCKLLKNLEAERLECRVENASLKGEIKALNGRVLTLEDELRKK